MKDLIIEQIICVHPPDTQHIRARVHQGRRMASKECSEEVRNTLSLQLQRTVDLNREPGAVSFATTTTGVPFNQARILGCASLTLWLDVIEHS